MNLVYIPRLAPAKNRDAIELCQLALRLLEPQAHGVRRIGRPVVVGLHFKNTQESAGRWATQLAWAMKRFNCTHTGGWSPKDQFLPLMLALDYEETVAIGTDDTKAVERCEDMAWRALDALGLANNAFAMVVHAHGPHAYIYLLVSTISASGHRFVNTPLVQLAVDLAEGAVARGDGGMLANLHQLQRQMGILLSNTKGDPTKIKSPWNVRYKMQARVADALVSAVNLEAFASNLAQRGVMVRPHLDGGRLVGLTYRCGAQGFSARELGYGLMVQALQGRFGPGLRLEAGHPIVQGWMAQSEGAGATCALIRTKSLSEREFNRLAARLPVAAGLKAHVGKEGVSFSAEEGQRPLFTITAEKVVVHATYRRSVERTMRVLRQVRWAREIVVEGTEAFVKTVCEAAARFNLVVSLAR